MIVKETSPPQKLIASQLKSGQAFVWTDLNGHESPVYVCIDKGSTYGPWAFKPSIEAGVPVFQLGNGALGWLEPKQPVRLIARLELTS